MLFQGKVLQMNESQVSSNDLNEFNPIQTKAGSTNCIPLNNRNY
jgi:hypothetical protein